MPSAAGFTQTCQLPSQEQLSREQQRSCTISAAQIPRIMEESNICLTLYWRPMPPFTVNELHENKMIERKSTFHLHALEDRTYYATMTPHI